MRVLLIEDEQELAGEIRVFLRQHHFESIIADSAAVALNKLDQGSYDFILLDIGLPDKDGLSLLREIRKDYPTMAIIIITARRLVEDKIKGLDMGADDYIAKPFSLLELHARMQAVLRRRFKLEDHITELEGFQIDIRNRTVCYKEHYIELSKKEFDLLSYLILHKNRPVSRVQLSDHLWGEFMDDRYDSNYIDVHIKNIRKKLTAVAPADWLETVRGIGYKIRVQ
ncbi:heavy metal response regulator transcription factor [Niabella terrae]